MPTPVPLPLPMPAPLPTPLEATMVCAVLGHPGAAFAALELAASLPSVQSQFRFWILNVRCWRGDLHLRALGNAPLLASIFRCSPPPPPPLRPWPRLEAR